MHLPELCIDFASLPQSGCIIIAFWIRWWWWKLGNGRPHLQSSSTLSADCPNVMATIHYLCTLLLTVAKTEVGRYKGRLGSQSVSQSVKLLWLISQMVLTVAAVVIAAAGGAKWQFNFKSASDRCLSLFFRCSCFCCCYCRCWCCCCCLSPLAFPFAHSAHCFSLPPSLSQWVCSLTNCKRQLAAVGSTKVAHHMAVIRSVVQEDVSQCWKSAYRHERPKVTAAVDADDCHLLRPAHFTSALLLLPFSFVWWQQQQRKQR